MSLCPLGCGTEHPEGWSHELFAAGRMLRALRDERLSNNGELEVLLEVLAVVVRYWLDTGGRKRRTTGEANDGN